MLPVSLDCPFVFFLLVYSYVASFSGLSFCRQSRETGNIEGTQDDEKQNDNPEAT
jgi:hypothetical protein